MTQSVQQRCDTPRCYTTDGAGAEQFEERAMGAAPHTANQVNGECYALLST